MMKEKLRTFYLGLFFCTFFLYVQQCTSIKRNSEVDSLKTSSSIAIAAVGDSVTSEISKVAGRAMYYLFFDENGVFLKSLKNPSQDQRSGASLGVVDLLNKESVKTVIAGRFGNKMKKLLETNKIEYHEHEGIAKDVVENLVKKQTE